MWLQFRWWLWLAASTVVGALALILVVSFACNGGDSTGTTTPTPTPATGASPSPGMPTETPVPSLEPTSYRFIYSEFGATEDIIWRIDPINPSGRTKIAAVPHETGWGIKPALSPDSEKIAYNAMPLGGIAPSTDGETHVLDLKSGETKLIAQGVSLLTTPRWSSDGRLLFLHRNVGEDVTVVLAQLFRLRNEDDDDDIVDEDGYVELNPPLIRTILRQHESDVQVYTPLGVSPDDATLYFIQIQGGTELGSALGRYAPASGEVVATATAIAEATATATAATPTPTPTPLPTPPPLFGDVFLFLSDQIVRNPALSPDASRVVFLVQGLVEGKFVFRAHIADIQSKKVSPLPSEGLSSGDQLGPIWHPDGDKVSLGQLPSGINPGRVATMPLDGSKATFLLPPEQGFDQPLSWSPDGKFLAVGSFPGESIGNPGLPRLVFVSPAGQRPAAPQGAEFEPIGWVPEE